MLFPGERTETYYIPYGKGVNGPVSAKGILWDKYINKRRVFRKVGLLNKDCSCSSTVTSNGKTVNSAIVV